MDSEDKLQLQKKDQKKSPERIKRPPILSPLKRPPSLRLVSPFDSDQELNDLEVASVLADGNIYLIYFCITISTWRSWTNWWLWNSSVYTDNKVLTAVNIDYWYTIVK